MSVVIPAGGWYLRVLDYTYPTVDLVIPAGTYSLATFLQAVEDALNSIPDRTSIYSVYQDTEGQEWSSGWGEEGGPFFHRNTPSNGVIIRGVMTSEFFATESFGGFAIYWDPYGESDPDASARSLALRDALGFQWARGHEGDLYGDTGLYEGYGEFNGPPFTRANTGYYLGNYLPTDGVPYVDEGGGGAGYGAGMLPGDRIDELRVSSVARTAEEIRQVHRRLFVYTQWSRELVHSLQPPGVYSQDPDSMVQRLYAVGADALATAWALTEELLEDFLPDRATRTLDRWEAVTGLLPGPNDTVIQRRTRALAFLRKIHGYSRASIADAIAPVLGVEPSAMVFVEGTNRIADDFAAAMIHGRWTQRAGGGTIAQAAGVLTLSFPSGSGDARWATSPRMTLGIVAPSGVDIYTTITALALGNTGDVAGLLFLDPSSGDGTVFGLRWNGSAAEFVHVTFEGAVEISTSLGAVPSLPISLRMREVSGTVELSYSTIGIDGPWTQLGAAHFLTDVPVTAGLVLIAEGAAPAGAGSVTFADARVWMPQSRDVFQWYVYSGGSPAKADLFAAQRLVNEMKPAHTRGIVIGTVFLTDDPDSLTDLDTLGV